VYLPAPEVGKLHRNPQLAATYTRVLQAADPLDEWYRGFVAEEIVEFQEREWMDSSGERHRGLLTREDMAEWRATWEEPLTVDYEGLTVLKAGPWSQAPVFLQQLRLLEGFDLAAMGHATADYVHTVTECAKLAFADREAYYGDPNFVDVPMEMLLSREYADERRALVGDEASAELRPGGAARLPGPVAAVELAPGVGEPTRGDTVHLDVVDRWGNMVAATPSGGWLWGAPVVPALGFCLPTRAQMFWLEEGLPNSLQPRKRPRTTLSPTMVARDGEPVLALGTPGGDQQDQWTLQVFLAHVHFGMNLQEAIDAPNHHTEAFPSSFYPRETIPRHVAVEERAGEQTMDGLRERGHDVEVSPPWSLGRVSAVGRDPDGQLKAGANPRGMQGYAAGR
jgi:gamma-glutamyltranspeptidase / glutathione hydrolase